MTISKSHTALAALAVVSLVGAPVAAQEGHDHEAEQQSDPQVEELQGAQGQQDQNQGGLPGGDRQQDEPQAGTDQPGTTQPPNQTGSATPAAASDMGTAESDAQLRKRARQKQNTARLRSESVQLSALDQGQVEELQRSLQERGYYQGEIDGIVGPATRRALRQFYSAQAQLASAGFILTGGAEALGIDEAEIERVKGEQEGQREPLRGTQPRPGAEQRQQRSERGQQPPQPGQEDLGGTRSTTPQQPGADETGQPPLNEDVEPMNPEPPMEDMNMGNPEGQP